MKIQLIDKEVVVIQRSYGHHQMMLIANFADKPINLGTHLDGSNWHLVLNADDYDEEVVAALNDVTPLNELKKYDWSSNTLTNASIPAHGLLIFEKDSP